MAQSIVVGTDGSGPSERALAEAIDIAARDGAKLHIVAAYPDPAVIKERIKSGATEMRINLRDIAEGVVARAERAANEKGVTNIETYLSDRDPAEALLDVAADVGAELIVVGSRGRGGLRRFL